MKGIIIYKGRYGATQQYAEWLASAFNLPVVPASNTMAEQLEGYDFFVLGSSVYIGKLQLASWLKENLNILTGKKIFFFQVAGTPPNETIKLNEYRRQGTPLQLREQLEVYFLHGKMNVRGLSWKDRFMLRVGAFLTKDPVIKKEMLTDYNDVKKENLTPLIQRLQAYLTPVQQNNKSKELSILKEYF